MTRLPAASMTVGLLFVSATAWAGPVTVWVEDRVPDEKTREKIDLQTGGTDHVDVRTLLYPPAPETGADQDVFEQLRLAIENGKARWDEFEVELQIANDIALVLDDLSLVRSDRDRDDLVRGLVFQGSAVARAFSPNDFPTAEAAAPWRTAHDTVTIPTAWVDAYALSGALAARGDLSDGTAWQDYQRFAKAIEALPDATLEVPADAGTVYVDGRVVEPGSLTLNPGRHWVHVVRDEVVSGRAAIRLAPGQQAAFPTAVDPGGVEATRSAAVSGRKGSVPDAVDVVLSQVIAYHDGGPLYLAADVPKRPVAIPYTPGAALKDTRLLTHVLTGEFGGGVFVSNAFLENVDAAGRTQQDVLRVAGAATASLGYELGVSYFMFTFGLDGMLTPGNSLPYGERPATTFDSASTYPQPFIGIGAYALRPTKPTPTFNVAATMQYLAPGWLAFGGRMAVGVPIADRTWFRISLGGAYAADSYDSPNATSQAITGWLRLGFGAGL